MQRKVLGTAAACLSSALGGTAIVLTRYVIKDTDPITLGALRFGVGFLFLLPVVLALRVNWPPRRDAIKVVALGLLFFALFPILFNASLALTTAARAALCLSTLPLWTLIIAALLRRESFMVRKVMGSLIAVGGVAIALAADLSVNRADAWRGDLLMVAAALCMAFYSIWSKPIIAESGPLSFTVLAMAAGAATLTGLSLLGEGAFQLSTFGLPQWLVALYLGIVGAALTFLLWALALAWTTPSQVTLSVTVNPIAASLLATVILNEALSWSLIVGLTTVVAGILISLSSKG